MTEEQIQDISFCKKTMITLIEEIIINADKVKSEITQEVWVSIIYLKFFSVWVPTQKIDTIDESWKFMNDIKGIVEKIFYVSNNLKRIKQSIEEKAKKLS